MRRVPTHTSMTRRWASVVGIALVLAAVVIRGRGAKPITVDEAVKSATNGAFYHWREFRRSGDRYAETREGWCALRRSRTLSHPLQGVGSEERRSPAGTYRKVGSRVVRGPGESVKGMEVGNDPLTETAHRLSGADAMLRSLGGRRYQAGGGIYTLERGSVRIVRVDSSDRRLTIDYPPAIDSGLFEAP